MIENRESVNQVVGFYRGIVKQHMPGGRCKIWIPAVYPEEYKTMPDKLPDAQQAAPLFAVSRNSNKNGTYSYPALESIVWCFFENNDVNYPVYFAATHEMGDAKAKWDSLSPGKENMKKIVVDKVEITINSSDKSIAISNGNANIEMTPDGKISLSGVEIELNAINSVKINGNNILTEGMTVKTIADAFASMKASRVAICAEGGSVLIAADDPYQKILVE